MRWTILKAKNGWVITEETPPVWHLQDVHVFESMRGLADWLVDQVEPEQKKVSGRRERAK